MNRISKFNQKGQTYITIRVIALFFAILGALLFFNELKAVLDQETYDVGRIIIGIFLILIGLRFGK